MPRLHHLSLVMALLASSLLLEGCKTPSYSSAYPDSRNSGPFWLRDDQRDR